jgi:hypothetical protein
LTSFQAFRINKNAAFAQGKAAFFFASAPLAVPLPDRLSARHAQLAALSPQPSAQLTSRRFICRRSAAVGLLFLLIERSIKNK